MREQSLTHKITLSNVNYKISNTPNADSIKSYPSQLRSIARVHERETGTYSWARIDSDTIFT